MSKVSMRDVAKRAGVSVATVSHVLNNTRFVSDETRERVMESIRALDYSIDAAARSFKTGKRYIIGFIVPDIANPFFATLIEEVENVLDTAGYKLIVINTKETPERELDNIRALANGSVDGFIVASTLSTAEELESVVPEDMPVVLIDRRLEGFPSDTIVTDNYRAMTKGVEHLIRAGHTRIGFITGIERISTTEERLAGYEKAMAGHNLSTEGLIRKGNSMSDCVAQELPVLLDRECTAIVVGNNVMAAEAMCMLLDRGILPGRGIEILGYKDHEMAQYGLQHMNIIAQPTVAMGRVAGRRMLKRLKDPDAPGEVIVIPSAFIPHRSGQKTDSCR